MRVERPGPAPFFLDVVGSRRRRTGPPAGALERAARSARVSWPHPPAAALATGRHSSRYDAELPSGYRQAITADTGGQRVGSGAPGDVDVIHRLRGPRSEPCRRCVTDRRAGQRVSAGCTYSAYRLGTCPAVGADGRVAAQPEAPGSSWPPVTPTRGPRSMRDALGGLHEEHQRAARPVDQRRSGQRAIDSECQRETAWARAQHPFRAGALFPRSRCHR
jgi:hypothetical protein